MRNLFHMILFFLSGAVTGAFCFAVWLTSGVGWAASDGASLVLPMIVLLLAVGYEFRRLVEAATCYGEPDGQDVQNEPDILIPAPSTECYEIGYGDGYNAGYEIGYQDALEAARSIKQRPPKRRKKRAQLLIK